MSISLPKFPPLPANTALVTMGDFEAWVERRKELLKRRDDIKIQRAELDHEEAAINQEVAALDNDIERFGPLVRRAAQSLKGQPVPALQPAPALPPQPPATAAPSDNTVKVDRRRLRAKVGQTAVEAMREIVVGIGKQNPDGFTTKQVFDAIKQDERFGPALRETSDGYRHALMKRFCVERLIVRITFGKYILFENLGNAEMIDEGAVMYTDEGYKVVPMTKAERIRRGIKSYLMYRPAKTSHRTQIAQNLAESGVLADDKNLLETLAQYLIRWPEFVSDGKGNYTYDPDKDPEMIEALGKGSGQRGGGSPTGP